MGELGKLYIELDKIDAGTMPTNFQERKKTVEEKEKEFDELHYAELFAERQD